MRIVATAAVADNGVIGSGENMLWHIPADLRRFKAVTTGNIVIFRRRTCGQIGLLPNRRTIVAIRRPDWSAEGVEMAHSIEEATRLAHTTPGKTCFIGRGRGICAVAWPHLTGLNTAHVHQGPKGTATSPVVASREWTEISREIYEGYDFVRYRSIPVSEWAGRFVSGEITNPACVRSTSSILCLDLDAFFIAVERHNEPSLRGKPVIVDGAGPRGVIATANYGTRVSGVRSTMSGMEVRCHCPHATSLGGRFDVCRQSSQTVMELLREILPLTEPFSFNEAYVDFGVSRWNLAKLDERVAGLRTELTRRTAGLTTLVGIGSSRLLVKLGSEVAKPDGARIIAPGEEIEFISPLLVRVIPGMGPMTERKLLALGLVTVADLRAVDPRELVRELGRTSGEPLRHLAHGRDDREVEAGREAKSISVKDTFPTDPTGQLRPAPILKHDAESVVRRLQHSGSSACTAAIRV